jgi:predicted nucleotidyltransferase/uncharacterized protein YbaR (Trm112 family)
MKENNLIQPPQKIEKRFLPATNDQAKERLNLFRNEVKNFQKNHPEFLGATLYGSMIKGDQAKKSSDIDTFLYIDAEKLPEQKKNDDYQSLEREYRSEFLNDLHVSPNEAKKYYSDLRTKILSNDILEKDLNERIEYDRQYKEYIKTKDDLFNEEYLNAAPDVQEKLRDQVTAMDPEFKSINFSIAGMFHARIGDGIQKYRRLFLEKLVAIPDQELSQDIWEDIYIHLYTMETRSDFSIKIEIPRMLNDALRLYHTDLYKEKNRKEEEKKIIVDFLIGN